MKGVPSEPSAPDRPRVIALDLGALGGGPRRIAPRAWSARDPALERVGALGGGPLAAALALERVRSGAPAPFCVAVGFAVRRGLPTAARASIAARAPASGRWAEAQVGSDLGRRLATLADLLALEGRVPFDAPGVLVLDAADGGARVVLLERPDLADLGPAEVARVLDEELGPAAILRVGAAARRGLAFANLSAGGTGEAGEEPPSFVGRGGLGAVFGRLGLAALVVRAAPVATERDALASALAHRLASSPRLVARAEGGTLELASAEALEGRLAAHGRLRSVAEATAWSAEGRSEARTARKGCAGCPTPCGYVFERPDGAARGARFGALEALGLALGLERVEDALRVLAACDAHGLDAKEVGALLALQSRAQDAKLLAGRPAWGDAAELERRVGALARGDAETRVLERGAEAAAQALGLEAGARGRGEALRGETDLAALLGQLVSARGADPMRSFAFLVGAGADPARLARLVPGLPPGAADPAERAGKGRVVAWHEAFVAAVDATGFCAFSAAGLLADGTSDLDELAAAIVPPEWLAWIEGARTAAPGRVLCAAGASAVLVERALDRALGAPPSVPPAWAFGRLGGDGGPWEEFRRARGLDEEGWPTAEALARVGTVASIEEGETPAPAPVVSPLDSSRRLPGELLLVASGPLAERLCGGRIALGLPASLLEALEEAERLHPRAAGWLVRAGAPVPAAFRCGARLAADARVEDGDELVLVLAIRGGEA